MGNAAAAAGRVVEAVTSRRSASAAAATNTGDKENKCSTLLSVKKIFYLKIYM